VKFVSSPSIATDQASLLELAITFLRLGATAFGGPAAHLAMMRSEFVDRRRWLTEGEFLDLIGASNLIPGPSSTEVAIFIGLRRAGWIGLILAGVFFILPAALIVTAIAWAYVRFGHLPQMGGVLYGVKPVIIAVVVQALWALGRTALKTRLISLAGAASLVLCFFGAPPIALLLGSGALLGVRGWLREPAPRSIKPLLTLTALATILVAFPLALTALEPHGGAQPVGLTPLFLVFAKVGSLVLGSGYVLLAFLRTDLILRLHWLTSAQLLDAVAVGQLTPGPVFTTATFIGYILAGPMGALAATLGIFLPAFLFVAVAGPLVPRIRRSPIAGSFLDGVNAAALALMAFVAWQLARAAFVDGLSVGISIAAAILLFRLRVNSAWLVLASAVIGLLFHSY
jgi:chromate transporter